MARGWTDRIIRDSASRVELTLLPGMLPLLPLAFIGQRFPLAWVIAAVWFVMWALFVSWRYLRYLKEISIKSDRHFDRVGKYDLPPEYADTESATKARQRRKS
ncbi:hypothetical protein [Sphingopyxis sp. YR583]|jgi:hypothetical protein|uniref:hypothetical protein n=1 Tax=Sphingopyxis sp. YR583 TaxID=1881047 RepID=UPI000B85DA0B|nr:hypothetical protein [Sphingopyxis sp. YR583]